MRAAKEPSGAIPSDNILLQMQGSSTNLLAITDSNSSLNISAVTSAQPRSGSLRKPRAHLPARTSSSPGVRVFGFRRMCFRAFGDISQFSA